ncbi:YadA family autotransporter adhesin [Aurantiacibacter odishensis]|uniref:YadA family autotransporter adhesin n=1 Tax=Aurantiacibacter odishensis TaxID=1155476 RepID=UPI000E71B355|nr:YadA-like family protein [Aurantiacibacter odishensis]
MRKTHTAILRATMMAGVGAASLTAPGFTKPVQAQALQPVVDVCTGISLDDSVLTDILTTTVVPTATGLETLYDNLLDIELDLVLGTVDLLDIPDVDLGIADTTAAIAAGDTISLQVLDTDGNVVSPGDCNLAADNFTLNEEGGLAIGGNQISGLGADGLTASAGELDAIALGNNASTAVGANGAIAIGTDASATAANSVALGAGSVADRGAQTGYTADFLAGTFDSAGSVSVGAPGALRQITNVAPGSAPTDAATVGQVQAAIDGVSASVANAVQYDDATQTSITLGGAGGTTIANLADGEVSATSGEAVNGSQLFATNQDVAANAADIGGLQTDVATNTTDITNLQTDVATNTTDIAALQDTAVQYDDATQASVTLGGAGGTTIANVADGEVSATSDEAVNGSQLFATNQDVAANAGDIADLQTDVAANTTDIVDLQTDVATNTTDIAALQDTAVQYDDATQASVTLGGAGGTTVTNVADGTLSAGSSDAVNGSQLFATNQQVDANTVAIQANADAILAIGSTGDPLGVTYDDATRTSITFDGAGGTTLANVADGEVSATSDEAVNGSQLFATNQAVADLDTRVTTNEGDIVDLDNRVTANETDIANIDARVTVNEGDIANNTTVIANLDDRVTINEGDIADIDARVTVNEGDIANNTTDIANLDDRVTVNEGDIVDIDGRVTVNEGDIADNSTAIANIDNRVTVNETSIVEVQQQLANVPIGYVDDVDPTMMSDTPTNTAALIGAGGDPVRLTNVAAGNVAAGSTDAVNGSQLAATNAAVAENRVDIDQNTSDIATINANLSGSTVVAVQYSDPDDPTQSNGGTITQDVTFVGLDSSAPVRVHNVANGTLANDAVNLGQLQAGLADVMSSSMEYTDQRFDIISAGLDQLAFDLDELRDEAFAGTAGAMALAGVPQTMDPGRSMVGGAIGHYRGETAFAIGASTTFNDGAGVLSVGGTIDTNGKGGFSAGAGISF